MTRLQKIIIGSNLLILMLYTIAWRISETNHLAIIGEAFIIACHVAALIFIAFIAHLREKQEIAKGFWLSTGIVLLIGFGTCLIVYN
jgi:hypothetical protein